MKKSSPTQWVIRIFFYVLGLFFMAMGVAFSVNSNLGVSPVNSLPYVISQVSGAALSTCVIAVFSTYIVFQILILRREFNPINLLQIVFSTIFGYFTDFTKWLLGDFALPTYAGQLVMLAISIVLVAVGVLLYIEVDLVPMPMEGFTMAISKKMGFKFHNVKVVVDCAVVVVGIVLSLTVFHTLVGIREGTVITAIVVGKLMAILKKPLMPPIRRLCFGEAADAPEPEEDKEMEALEGMDEG